MPTVLEQQKRGLENEHDPSDIGRKVNEKTKGDYNPPKRSARWNKVTRGKTLQHDAPDSDVIGGAGSQGGDVALGNAWAVAGESCKLLKNRDKNAYG